MCIAIITTSHPDYPLILINNRDEYLHRPTDPASWWPSPDSNILAGRDLYRSERGSWLGITRQGRLACLTNFKEDDLVPPQGRRSRGAMVNAYLRTPSASNDSSRTIAQNLIAEGVRNVGGFSLVFGHLRKPSWKDEAKADGTDEESEEKHWQGLAIVSNRSEDVDDVEWICTKPGETHALSNTHYSNKTWPKVTKGEEQVAKAIETAVSEKDSTEELIARLLNVLAQDTLPRQKNGEDWSVYLGYLRQSIFIPAIGKDREEETPNDQTPLSNGQKNTKVLIDSALCGVYGTQKQTVILVDWTGKVTYVERTLFDPEANPIDKGHGDRRFDFTVEGW